MRCEWGKRPPSEIIGMGCRGYVALVAEDMLYGLPRICCMGCRGIVAICRKIKSTPIRIQNETVKELREYASMGLIRQKMDEQKVINFKRPFGS